jgi:hypothetical protein
MNSVDGKDKKFISKGKRIIAHCSVAFFFQAN